MPSGVRVWSSSGALRLDPGDKQVMHYAYYSGTLTGGGSSTTTVTIGGGYDITSGDWGIDITLVDYYLEAVSTSNTVTLTNKNPSTAGYSSIFWRINVFKLNQ